MKYSASAVPAYGAMYWSVAGSEALAHSTIVWSIAPSSRSRSTTPATVEARWPIATYTQTTSPPRWLMMASIAMAVLPVRRSPMISSRCPRPIGIIESIALSPVWSGASTGLRNTIPGALRSTFIMVTAAIGPLPSSGSPRALTTRPRNSGPAGIARTRPVRRAGSPSFS